MNDALNRRIANYLGRLIVYFDRPQIFDTLAMMKEAHALEIELDNARFNEVQP